MPTRVLIIDDDASFRRLVEMKLRSFLPQMELLSADTLGAARTILARERQEDAAGKASLDLVILDQHLPDGRGLVLLKEGWFQHIAVLCVSSDTAPEMPGATIEAGAAYFLSKVSVSEALFQPLVLGIIERNRLGRELERVHTNATILETVKTLAGTLRHEINNPLGAVLGAAYLLRNNAVATPEQREAAQLVEESGKRIKHVLDQLCDAVAIESITKANTKVFHIPGDKPWQSGPSVPDDDDENA